jgi:hypothetical protein
MRSLQVDSPKGGVCVNFHHEGPFIEVEGSQYRLNQVSLEEMDGPASIHVAGRPLLPRSTDFQCWIPLVNRRRNVTVKSQAEPTQRLANWARGWAGRPAPGPTWPRVWPHLFYVSHTPLWSWWFWHWSISLCHPLKYSNLVPKFLRSNKH